MGGTGRWISGDTMVASLIIPAKAALGLWSSGWISFSPCWQEKRLRQDSKPQFHLGAGLGEPQTHTIKLPWAKRAPFFVPPHQRGNIMGSSVDTAMSPSGTHRHTFLLFTCGSRQEAEDEGPRSPIRCAPFQLEVGSHEQPLPGIHTGESQITLGCKGPLKVT